MNWRLLALTFLFALTFGISAKAAGVTPEPLLLTIDDSDPSNMIITATGSFSWNDDSSTTEEQGIDLLAFLTSGVVGDPSLSPQTLTPSGGTLAYNSWALDSYSGSSIDFHIYRDPDGTDTQIFSTTSAAFEGAWGIDVSGLVGSLPADGATGNILAGFNDETSGTIIGEWTVVPEPSQYGMLVVLAFAGLLICRKSSRQIS